MAKSMAKLDDNGYVINIEWCSDKTVESDILKNIKDYPVNIGDEYKDGRFYRNGNMVLSLIEEIYQKNNEYSEALQLLGVDLNDN